MFTLVDKIHLHIKKYSSIKHIALSYRYISVLITSVFFVIFTDYTVFKKSLIIVLIFIASITLNYLYSHNEKNIRYMLILLTIETFFTAVIIIFTGGSNSPFIWYAFNAILVCFIMLDSLKYSLICLFVYLLSITMVPYIILRDYYNSDFNSNTLLCLILISCLLYVLYKCSHDINKKNNELKDANVQIKESMDHILNLYNTMHIFTNKNSKDDIIQQVIDCLSLIFDAENVIYFIKNSDKLSFKGLKNVSSLRLIDYVNSNYNCICQNTNVLQLEFEEIPYVFYPIRYNLNAYGILTLQLQRGAQYAFDSLVFIAELSSILFEKYELEIINNDLLINEEQNRIANDIHDGVLQGLFSVSCNIYMLMKNIEIYNTDLIKTNLNTIRNSINDSMLDLRKTIYSLSLYKDGKNIFINDLDELIKKAEKTNDVCISFDFNGDTEMLSILQKKSIYRIISELLSNSIRHSQANNIEIKINVNDNVSVVFKDDGVGFDFVRVIETKQNGLGLKNIEHLVNGIRGSFEICSLDKKGTTVSVIAPLSILTANEE